MRKLQFYIDYLCYLLCSKSKYSIHSPFVYDFIVKVLNDKSSKKNQNFNFVKRKYSKLIHRIINYYRLEKVLNLIDFKENESLQTSDFIFFDIMNSNFLKLFTQEKNLNVFHNESIVFVYNIHKSKEYNILWKKIISKKKITVSIDLFFAGIIFFRKEQVKQNFILRF